MRVLVIDPGLKHVEEERNAEGPLSFFFSPDLGSPLVCDLIVLPAGLLLEGAGADRDVLRIAYGPASLTADAFAEGCADYLREPWDLEELEARALRFLTWRFRLGEHPFTYSTGRLAGAAGTVALPEGERRALELLLHSLGRPVPRKAFLRVRHGPGPSPSRRPDMTICRLRSRLARAAGDSRAGSFLAAVRNYGYRLDGTPCA
ncbi:MAG TPA: hypothetical protein P5313_08980 [Spirochaetia bacterium]|nr:hypothetical protein [Spirochaetales bacterium]HRY80537.1 hypothetical protein [Spirochaetia bacterium]